jgi:hypothetical protein
MLTTYGATEGQDEAKTPAPDQASRLSPEQLGALQRLIDRRDELDPEKRATVEAVAKANGLAISPKQGFTQLTDPRKEQMSDLGEAAKVSALPMGGQLLGGIAGAVIGKSPQAIMAGQSVGGIAGLLGNKALGISKPEALDAALTGAVPYMARGAAFAGRRAIPGVEAAEQQIGAELLRKAPDVLPGSKEATKTAYDQLEALGSPNMPVPNLQRSVSELLNTEMTSKKYGGASPIIRRAVIDAGKTLQAQNGEMPFRDVSIMLKRYRQKTADLESKGGEVWGAYKELRKSLFDDMALAEKGGGAAAANVEAQRAAMATARQQIAKDELSESIEKYGVKTVTVNGQTFEVIDPTKVLNKLKDMGFAESVGTQQYQKIEQTLKHLAAIPKVNMATGTGVGTPMRATAMAGAGILGSALGVGASGGVAGAAGAAGAIMAHDAVASLFMSDKGRDFLVKLFKANKGRMRETTGQMLQFAASQMEDTTP